MDTIKNPLEKIETCKNNNLSTLLFLESLKDSPRCVAKAALNWTEGERNSLTLAIAGVLKKVSKVSVDEAIDIITKIVEYNNDEELSSRITGMRQGELMGLTWDSINWVTRKITVDKNFTHGRVGTPKTGKIRKVDMSLELVKILKEWRLACPKGEHNLVFPNSYGGYQDANNMIKRRFKPALNRAGINHLRFHDLRHTYASLLLDNIVEQTTIVDARKFGT